MSIVITGGAGFIGCNLADDHLRRGEQVIVFDDLSRSGSESNLAWLRDRHGERLKFIRGDVRDFEAVKRALSPDAERVYHLAGQVAVTTSVQDPRADFEVNALGTLNVLEAVRAIAPQAILLYASTNKVYGGMEQVAVVEERQRYRYVDYPLGISEDCLLDFHSPYGCSKGAGDQYVRDYARIYGLRTVVFRQSCIYGWRQFGVEDQGWVAHFCIAAQLGYPIKIYGNGKQVRDVLWIEDLLAAYEAAARHIDVAAGQVYNIGGGPDNTLSIWVEFGALLESLAGQAIQVDYGDWRPGDQSIYVSDIRKAQHALHWQPRTPAPQGISKLWDWIHGNLGLFHR